MLYKSMQIAAGNAGGESYWLGVVSEPLYSTQFYTFAIDSQNNLYWTGRQYSTTNAKWGNSLLKLDSNGSQVWTRNFSSPSFDLQVFSLTFDSDNNILMSGSRYGVDYQSTGTYSFVAKYDSFGNLQFTKGWGDLYRNVTYYASTFYNNTWYVAGSSPMNTSGGNNTANISTVNSSTGNVATSKELFINSSRTSTAFGVDIDSSANIYVGGTNNDGTSYNKLWVYKLNSAYTKLWERLVYEDTSQNTIGRGLKLDSSEQPCVVGTSTGTSGENDLFVAKLNTSGTNLWRRKLGKVGFSELTYWDKVIDLDSEDNIYVCGRSNNGSTNVAVYAKYDSAGTLQWQRFVSAASDTEACFIQIGQNDSMYIGGIVSSTPRASFLMKLPNDGSLTGTYGGFVYGVFDAVASSTGGGAITNSSATAQNAGGSNSTITGTSSTSMVGSYALTTI